jgi:hypothetical protein
MPAPASIETEWLKAIIFFTVSGVAATLDSPVTVSFKTPIFIIAPYQNLNQDIQHSLKNY